MRQIASRVGMMVERLQVEENNPPAFTVSSLTRASNVATATTATAHGYVTGDYVTIAGATPAGYNGKFKVTVTGPSSFTYLVASTTLVTPATGSITVTYVSDSMGGQNQGWRSVGGLEPAELLPTIRSWEVLQNTALQSEMDYRFRIRRRIDITAAMRVRWIPMWPPGAPEQVLQISGVALDDDGRRFQILECKGA